MSLSFADTQTAKPVHPQRVGLFMKTSLVKTGLSYIIASHGFDVLPDDCDLRAAQPDMVIVEAESDLAQTAAYLDHIKAMCPHTLVVVLAETFDRLGLLQLQAAGADGFCLTMMRSEVLIKALEIVLLGHMFVPSGILDRLLEESASSPASLPEKREKRSDVDHPSLHKLSQREAHILRMLMRGDANKVIANKLDIAEATVKVHVKAILRKIQVSNRTQAAIWASEHLAQDTIDGHTPAGLSNR
ncbi:LuxR C-terminal-related transcriptional regulator [Microvirga pudoricolor]|uniref:LuxR C-terminal-related transcriptional regulator n=1 Tax=Microvirga pudoricolor TaxID=2778729 RepID=UPI00194E21DA|nr:response regulator transcription factor [Microvirga pudoricolor]MBM6596777.1 response regulator transcription factor [Microvirga pudoricolor]